MTGRDMTTYLATNRAPLGTATKVPDVVSEEGAERQNEQGLEQIYEDGRWIDKPEYWPRPGG